MPNPDNPLIHASLVLVLGGAHEAQDCLARAGRFAERAKSHGAPDFTERIETLRQQADNLANDINEAIPVE